MKQLLGMARQKKEKEGPRPITNDKSNPVSKISKPIFEPPSESEAEYEEAYEITEEQLFGYAEFLGIKLPQEEDLLWIAEEGLCAELPDDWTNQ